MVQGLSDADAARLVAHRGGRTHAFDPYGSVEEAWRRTGLPRAALERLAEADAFRGLGLDRRQVLWAVRGLADAPLPLFAGATKEDAREPEAVEPPVALPPVGEGREVVEDYRSTGLSLGRHPVAFLREELRARGMVACADLVGARDGAWVVVPGLVLVRQRPGSAKGVTFVTVEDETGVANLIVRPSLLERQRRIVLSAGLLACSGRVQREGAVVHVVAHRLEDLSDLLRGIEGRDGGSPRRPGHGAGAALPDGPGARAAAGPGGGIKVPTRDFR